jgi:hypothetical protein
MEDQGAIAAAVATWIERFSRTLDRWSAWLGQVEEAYVRGSFTDLIELEAPGQAVQRELASSHQERAGLLQAAHEVGLHASSITRLAKMLGHHLPESSRGRLSRLSRDLMQVQQRSAMLCVTGFQASSYTNSLLEILATGHPDRATYSPGERDALEGGQIVDAAA